MPQFHLLFVPCAERGELGQRREQRGEKGTNVSIRVIAKLYLYNKQDEIGFSE